MSKKITIAVSGPNAAGKTHIIAAIQNMLEEEGLAVTVTGMDNNPQSYAEIRERVDQRTLSDLLPKITEGVELVELYGVQTKRANFTHGEHPETAASGPM